MFSSVTPLTGLSSWARSSGLEIVLLVAGAILMTRLATWTGARITDRIDANARETDALVCSEASKHRHALAQVITWAALVLIYCATGVLIAARLGIPVTSLVAPAAVVAVALAFGAQRIVQDILAASSSSPNASTASGTSSASRCRACPPRRSGPSRTSPCG